MIVEYATVTRRDGTESTFGREKGRKQFALLTPAGVPDPMGLGYSRRSLNERPEKDRNVVGVSFERPTVDDEAQVA